ncbi:MAG TPA: 50S ribosomal protein L23 [Candidatus Paceibacterota bacterium]|nr:50S ribosomal protein L23 [Candidatus Paceibacterota bacterium]
MAFLRSRSKKINKGEPVAPKGDVGIVHAPANFKLIRKAWLSEKAASLGVYNQYVFLVNKSANKNEVGKEVSRRYGVKVASVNIIRQKSKTKRVGNVFGRASGFKKAVVTLAKGEKLEIS